MLEPELVEVTVELLPGSGPISGRIRYASGASQPFAGWLELSTTLEQARPRTASARLARGETSNEA